MVVKFGPSGNSESFYQQGNTQTIQAGKWLAVMGLDLFEYSFGRGITISKESAALIGQEFKKYNVNISVHAPYYINFANTDDSMAEKSYAYVLNSCKRLADFGGQKLVFHASTVGKLTRQQAVELTKKRLNILTEKIYQEGLQSFYFCPETMGKINQIGDVEEIVDFCKIDKIYLPTIDFGHLNARTHGGLQTQQHFDDVIAYIIAELGYERASKMHVHFSKIEYSVGGEVRHLTFADKIYGPEFKFLANSIKKYNIFPTIISESNGTQAEDALEMKKIYFGE